MKRAAILLCVSSVLSGAVLAAQLYRWVDEKGNVEWRDTPPPPGAKKVEQRNVGGSTIETSTLPYSVQVAVKNFPVTLWTSNCGAACDQAKALLARRGVPYSEKDAQADVDAFQKLTGSNEVPVLFVGTTKLKGFLQSEWDAALDNAGYPRTALTTPKPPAKGAQASKEAAPSKETQAKSAAGQMPPVRLFTHPSCGAPCEEARSLLAGRGVNFEEVSVQSPSALAELKSVSGGSNVPVLTVGQSVMGGFVDTDYHKMLDSAGFPRK